MNRDLILSIDIGTSSVRAALYDHAGNTLRGMLVKNERRLKSTPEGGSEIGADEAVAQTVAAVDQLLAASKNVKGEITHVAACAFWHSLVGVDASGRPTTKVLGWADNRSRDQVALLRAEFNDSDVHNRTGARFHSSFWPAKLFRIRKEQPGIFARTAMWLSLSDYLATKLVSDSATSISMASGTGLFDIRKCKWDTPLLKFLQVSGSSLPDIARSKQTFRINKKFARRWPRLAGAQWFPAVGDGAANNIGSGCVTRSQAALMVGTSGAMRVAIRGKAPRNIPSGLWCYRIDRERVVVGGALSDGGGLYDWLDENFKLPTNARRAIAKSLPDKHGLTFLPFLSGERSTGYNENASGAIIGITSYTKPADIAAAAMESIAFRFAEIFEQLNKVTKIKEIDASGGALRASGVWTQIIADILGREIKMAAAPEASLRGAVLLALESIGNIENINTVTSDSPYLIVPNVRNHMIYSAARSRHQHFYDLIINNR